MDIQKKTKSDEPKTYYSYNNSSQGFYVQVRNPKTGETEPLRDKQGNLVFSSRGEPIMRERHLQFMPVTEGRSTGANAGKSPEPLCRYTVIPTENATDNTGKIIKVFSRFELDVIDELEKLCDDPLTSIMWEDNYQQKSNPHKFQAEKLMQEERAKMSLELSSRDKKIAEMDKQLKDYEERLKRNNRG